MSMLDWLPFNKGLCELKECSVSPVYSSMHSSPEPGGILLFLVILCMGLFRWELGAGIFRYWAIPNLRLFISNGIIDFSSGKITFLDENIKM